MSFVYMKPIPDTYPIAECEEGYYYTDRTGAKLSRIYKTKAALLEYGQVIIWN